MKHLDLFSGIGGFALAADWTWPNVEHVLCEIDPFCQAVLRKHWPNAPIYGDIRQLTTNAESRQQQQLAVEREQDEKDALPSRANTEPIFLLTGGFPCQPFSVAGQRRGTEDDRYLWPEMLRVIREFHPRWVIGENVGGFVTWSGGMVLEQVHADLESEGYAVQAFVIPACAVNAPHRRDRVWIVANAGSERRRQDTGGALVNESAHERRGTQNDHLAGGEGADTAADAAVSRRQKGNAIAGRTRKGEDAKKKRRGFTDHRRNASDSASEQMGLARQSRELRWSEDWLAAATRLCSLDDGLPNGLVRPSGWRNAALKAAGNAIVPQVAAEIMKAIKAADV